MVALGEVVEGRCKKLAWDQKATEQIPEKRNPRGWMSPLMVILVQEIPRLQE